MANLMEKILVIDDSMVIQAQLADILQEQYEVFFAADGPAGIAAANERLPALILLDIRLPSVDGYAVCRELKNNELTSDVPILFITSLEAEQERLKGFEAGGEDYIVKPFYPLELLARVRVHLDSRLARKQAVELERLKLFREMAVALSHEINNPLTSLYGYFHLLEREGLPHTEKVSEFLSAIHADLERIRNLTTKLAKASYAGTTQYDQDTTMLDLHNI